MAKPKRSRGTQGKPSPTPRALPRPPSKSPPSSPWLGLTLAYFALFATVASILFARTLWGVASPHYFSWAVGAGAVLLFMLSLSPRADRLLASLCGRRDFSRVAALAGAALMVGAWFNRIELNWLGDQSLWIRDVAKHDLLHPIEPLSYQLVEWAHHGLMPVVGEDGERLLSVLLGGLFLYLAWGLSGALVQESPARRNFLWLLLCAVPHLLFYFGYVESYPYLLLGLMAAAWGALRILRGGNPWLAGAGVLTAGTMHLFGAGAMAAAAAAAWFKKHRLAAVVIPAVTLALMIAWLIRVNTRAAYFVNDHQTTFTFFDMTRAGWHRFLGWGHVRGMLNILLLTVGPALCLIPFIQWRQAWSSNRQRLILLALYLAPALGGLLLLRMLLGAPRDWDLFAAYLYFGPLALYWLWLSTSPGAALPRFSAAVLTAGLLHAGFWIGVNLDRDRGMEQARMLYGAHSHQARKTVAKAAEELGIQEREAGNYASALAWFEVCIEKVPKHWRYYHVYANAAFLAQDEPLAKEYYWRALDMEPDADKPYSDLGTVLLMDSDGEGALKLYRLAQRRRGHKPQWFLGLGTAYTYLKDFPKAVAVLDSSLALYPDYKLPLLQRGAAKHFAGDNPAAIADLKEGLSYHPDQREAWRILRQAALDAGDTATAVQATQAMNAGARP